MLYDTLLRPSEVHYDNRTQNSVIEKIYYIASKNTEISEKLMNPERPYPELRAIIQAPTKDAQIEAVKRRRKDTYLI